jgi:hypothetical protein
MSSFSWLDYSESERDKVLKLVSALGDRDTRDELGIGTVRDSFADLLFPGTSTIQTRARYFLFVPWIYLIIEKRLRSNKAAGKDEIAKRLRNEEISLINYLAKSNDPEGTIGIDARKTLKRLPSSIYWNGLSAWGIRICNGSQDQYNHALDVHGSPKPLTMRSSEDPIETGKYQQNWHPGLPSCPKNFPYVETSLSLTGEEAGYLRERIMHNAPGSFLAFLVDQGKSSKPVQFPWEHPQVGELSSRSRKSLQHAQNFSEIINGASLLYNHLLAKASEHNERILEYNKKFADWSMLIQSRQETFQQWDLKEFWEIVYSVNSRIPRPTKTFIDTWFDLVLKIDDPQGLLDNHQAENFIRDRERFLKRGQARLMNQRALELWGGAAGTNRLNYRWSTVQTILADIQKAYTGEYTIA